MLLLTVRVIQLIADMYVTINKKCGIKTLFVETNNLLKSDSLIWLVVKYLLQKQAVGWGGGAACGPVLGLQYRCEFLGGEFSPAHLKQGADEVAHHVPQETVPGKAEGELVFIVAGQFGGKDCPDGTASCGLGFVPCAAVFKRCEVMGAFDCS